MPIAQDVSRESRWAIGLQRWRRYDPGAEPGFARRDWNLAEPFYQLSNGRVVRGINPDPTEFLPGGFNQKVGENFGGETASETVARREREAAERSSVNKAALAAAAVFALWRLF
jgi:hypothetical protein